MLQLGIINSIDKLMMCVNNVVVLHKAVSAAPLERHLRMNIHHYVVHPKSLQVVYKFWSLRTCSAKMKLIRMTILLSRKRWETNRRTMHTEIKSYAWLGYSQYVYKNDHSYIEPIFTLSVLARVSTGGICSFF
jgi:hypothetical protein